MAVTPSAIALIVRTPPYRQRAARAQTDVAAVAAALGCPLRLYFVGLAALQLRARREPGAAALPAGYRAWASLTELTEVRAWVEPRWLRFFPPGADDWLLAPAAMEAGAMARDWRRCAAVLVL